MVNESKLRTYVNYELSTIFLIANTKLNIYLEKYMYPELFALIFRITNVI